MNPSTFQARAMVKALIKHGVESVVIAPGSRNGALSIALAQAHNHINLLTRIDERTASFTALGIAKRTAKPVAVVCTSGTASAHFTAAAFEAREAGVPLILITADRPAAVRGRGANQTIEQVGMFANAVIDEWDLPIASSQDELYWELAVANAVTASLGDEYSAAGPVHLNVPFAEPLIPHDADVSWTSTIVRGELPKPHRLDDVELKDLLADMGITTDAPRGVIVISDPHSAADAIALAKTLRWPLLAEPGSSARVSGNAIAHYAKILSAKNIEADVVITAGRFGLSRAVMKYVTSSSAHIAVGRYPLDADPMESAKHHLARMPLMNGLRPAPEEWLAMWQSEAASFAHDTDSVLTARSATQLLTDFATSRDVLWVSASSSVRIVDDVASIRNDAPMTLVNRGTNGIDGLIASATGAATQTVGRTFLLIGDVAFLHDASSLFLPSTEVWPNLTIVVLDNNGGAIFKTLEQGDSAFDDVYDKVYGTPHDKNLVALAQSAGLSAVHINSLDEMRHELTIKTNVLVVNLRS
ncbi:MAG: 2-succinyl-5-enolpyruvyl-6-hydroxy-3-cyclohexene-carboxylic-acid synthase [Actinomycetota bacterium]